MNKLQATDRYAARLLMVGFFLPLSYQATAIILACVYFFCRAIPNKNSISFSRLSSALILGSGFLLCICALPMTPFADKPELWLLIGNKMSLLLTPLLFSIIMPSFGEVLINELKYFVYAALFIGIVSNCAFFYSFYFTNHTVTSVSHVAYRLFMEGFTGLHPTYLSMYFVLAICILLCGFVHVNVKAKFLILFILLTLLFAMLAKSPIIASIVIFAHYGYRHRQKLKRYAVLIVGFCISIVIVCSFIPFVGQRIGEITSYFTTEKRGSVTDNSLFVRKFIWDVDTHLIKQNWLTGIGPARLSKLLHYRYFFYSIYHCLFIGYYDPHSEYFWQWIAFGLMGLFVCLFVLVIHFAKAIINKNNLYLYLLLTLAITYFTESVLARQQGILLYAVFTSLFFFYKENILDNN